MSKYNIELFGTSVVGIEFIKNLAKYSKLGAEIIEGKPLRNKFPHKAYLYIETETLLESETGVNVIRLDSPYTKQELLDMEWDDFREIVREHGVTGRSRDVMIHKYLSIFN